MRYKIRSQMPGRLRLALLCPLDKNEARGVEIAIEAVSGVHRAEAHEANSSLLILFDPSVIEDVLAAVASLNSLQLPRADPSAIVPIDRQIATEDNRFLLELGKLAAWRGLRWLLLPLPLRNAWVVARAFRYIFDGLRCLMQGTLTVEVLDATAIGASLVRRTFGEADVIMLLLELSDVMERHVSSRTQLMLEQGLIARDEQVIRIVMTSDGLSIDEEVPLASLAQGDLVRIRTGMVVPVDGVVESGEGEVDESSMTGEALLVHKDAGASAFAGTALADGELVVRCTTPPGQARIDAITAMVERSSALKGASASRAERLADTLVPWAFGAFLGIYALTRSIDKALAVLMVDYSCALKISTPLAVMSAMREAASRGIVVKGGRYLEELAAANTIIFDKTGTLTEANPQLVAVVPVEGYDADEVLRLAACIEEHYPHSVARAIVDGARKRGLSHDQELHANVHYVVAHGIAAEVGNDKAVIGSAHFVFEDEAVPLPEGFAERVEAAAPGTGVVYLAHGGKLLGALCVADPLRPEAAKVIAGLRTAGLHDVVMLTGDSTQAAARVADELGLTSFHAQVLPEHKADYVEQLKAAGNHVVMVGDGINDSPALAAASVSVALADASDIAQAVADISIRNADLQNLLVARELSERLMHRIHQRYRLIVGLNSTLIVLGVASLIPLTTAATLHNLSTVLIAASNATPLLPERHQR